MADAPAKPANLDDIVAEAAGRVAEARPYDLAGADSSAPVPTAALERIHSRFAAGLASALSDYLGRDIEVTAGPLTNPSYGEFLARLPRHTSLNPVQVSPLAGSGLVVFDARLVFIVVDLLFGGPGRCDDPMEERAFSPTEQRIIQGLLGAVLTAYRQAWAPTQDLQFEPLAGTADPRIPDIASLSDPVVATRWTLALGAASAHLHICLPSALLAPLRETLRASAEGEATGPDRRRAALLSRQLQDAQVELVAHLGEATLSLRDLLQMQPGDVIPITVPEPIRASVDGVPVLEGRYGTHGNHYAIQVERLLNTDDPDAPPHPSGAQNGR